MKQFILGLLFVTTAGYSQGVTATPATLTPQVPFLFERTLTNLNTLGGSAGIQWLYLVMSADGSPQNQNGPSVCKMWIGHYPGYNWVYLQGVTSTNLQTYDVFSLVDGVWKGPNKVLNSIGPCSIDLGKTSISYPSPTSLKLSIWFNVLPYTHGQMDAIAGSWSLIGEYHRF